MITLTKKCPERSCEDGKFNRWSGWPAHVPEYIVCPTCNGRGIVEVKISAHLFKSVNYGDHGEVQIKGLDVPGEMTLNELLTKLWFEDTYRADNLVSLVFTKAEVYHLRQEEEKIDE